VEAQDNGPRATALRETAEEIGLASDAVHLTAQLDPYHTRTGFAVTPFVGVLDPPAGLQPDPAEVAEVFEVPLTFILHPKSRETHSVTVRGAARHYHVFPYGPYYIWGATAGMLVNLAEVLRRPC
jgi:8-oxo-dGTP pyrophosphatase MutT (NUDIX family)